MRGSGIVPAQQQPVLQPQPDYMQPAGSGEQFPTPETVDLSGSTIIPQTSMQEAMTRLSDRANNTAPIDDGPQGFEASVHKIKEQVLPRLLERVDPEAAADAVVVNLLDQKLWNLNPDFFSYTLSKAALHAATTMLAQALAPRLRVVGVAPGLTLTSHMLSQEKFETLHRLSPLGRSSTAEDVVATVLFALTNSSVTGTSLLVDGGQHLTKFERDFSLM